MNSYNGLVSAVQVNYLRSQARRLGFSYDELPDLEQQIVPHLCNEACSEEANPKAGAFARKVIRWQLAKELRNRNRDVRSVNFKSRSLEQAPEPVRHRTPHAKVIELRLDLERAMPQLTARERMVCGMLEEGHTQAEIARKLGVTRPAVHGTIKRIADKFREMGLEEYTGKAG